MKKILKKEEINATVKTKSGETSIKPKSNLSKRYFKRGFKHMSFMIITPLFVIVLSMALLFNHYYYAAILVYPLIPILLLLQFGTIKDRMLNILPLVVLLTYVIVSLETKDFKSSMVVYFIIPILSVLLKPKKHYIKYLTLIVSFLTLSLKYFKNMTIPFYYNLIIILIIYAVFLPPFIKKKIQLKFHL